MPRPNAVQLPELMTPAEVAGAIRSTVADLYRLNYQGTGPTPTRLGRRLLYRADDVQKWLDARRSPS